MLPLPPIAKASGSSLKMMVERRCSNVVFAYERQLALASPNLEFALAFRRMPRPHLTKVELSYGAHRLLGVAPSYATALREPVARVVSLYRYKKTLLDSPFAAELRKGMPLADFVGSELTEMPDYDIACPRARALHHAIA